MVARSAAFKLTTIHLPSSLAKLCQHTSAGQRINCDIILKLPSDGVQLYSTNPFSFPALNRSHNLESRQICALFDMVSSILSRQVFCGSHDLIPQHCRVQSIRLFQLNGPSLKHSDPSSEHFNLKTPSSQALRSKYLILSL